ncbi:unnamed protein product [Blepharisma stoltei]|uniref:RING-type domain-containing protein n=1 Tax=Blepharisma stoltei TaxID=1481888 RepID=A0AAU9J114_9CILI|nr:unnamed protein product [Blepharisma stoltei]
MEAQLECPVCLTKYTTKSNRPKSLHCGHNICCECTSGLLLKPKPSCPLCLREIININSIEDLGDAWFILDRLNFIELVCQNHPQQLASYFNTHKYKTLKKFLQAKDKNSEKFLPSQTKKNYAFIKNYQD